MPVIFWNGQAGYQLASARRAINGAAAPIIAASPYTHGLAWSVLITFCPMWRKPAAPRIKHSNFRPTGNTTTARAVQTIPVFAHTHTYTTLNGAIQDPPCI